MLTQEQLKHFLHYDPLTGVFIWRERTPAMFNDTKQRSAQHRCAVWNARYAHKVAGRLSMGYIGISINDKKYQAQCLAWLYMMGEWPSHIVDHKNRKKDQNNWDNLRAATKSQNSANSTKRAKLKGVSKIRDKWRAQIKMNGVYKHLGVRDCPAAAHFLYQIAADNFFGEYARIS